LCSYIQIAQPDGSTFEDAFGKLRKCPERELPIHPARHFRKLNLVKHAMNSIGHSAEPNREFVERAIVEVLEIAHRQGITAANFVKMLDSGLRMSDFLTAIDPSSSTDQATHWNFS
jgi:hypothetical protein